jgi:hemin uptake protein HemP
MNGHQSSDANGLPSSIDASSAKPTELPLRVISSSEILQGAREVVIQHDEKLYRLQVTRNGKLILVK